MIIRVCAFSENGKKLAEAVRDRLDNDIIEIKGEENLDEWICEAFVSRIPLVFIGAVGIAVRKIAPFLCNKLKDPAVVVMDEKGKFAIPVLSGHVGGANDLAMKLSEELGADAVITTATDVEETFSVDLFAKKNGYRILNKDGIKKVSAKVLNGEKPTWRYYDEMPKERVESDICVIDNCDFAPECPGIVLTPKKYVLGVGCKKDIPEEIIEKRVAEVIREIGIAGNQIENNIWGLASIDLKAKEYGLNLFAQKNGLLFKTYSADELNLVKGDFTSSDFVNSKTGTDNVCERAAMLMAGANGELVIRKNAGDGVTVALARRGELSVDE